MKIHIVRPGDTAQSIAREWNIPLWLLLKINGLTGQTALVEGQTILLLFPEQLYTVKEGDTLYRIAAMHGLTLQQLFRNNPWLLIKSYIYPGEPVIIRYTDMPAMPAVISGYAYPFIDVQLFLQTLPYITIFNSFTYEITEEGHLSAPGDDLLISLSKKLGTRPHMVVSNLREPYGFDPKIAHHILGNTKTWKPLIDEIIAACESKGYSGVDIDFEYVPKSDRKSYPDFMAMLHERLSSVGRMLTAALSAKTDDDAPGRLVEGLDYAALGASADAVLLMTYEWGYAAGEPMAVAPLPEVKKVLDYAVTRIPRKKLLLGIPNYGYDWPEGPESSRPQAVSIGNAQAVDLARSAGVSIKYDDRAQAPWFTYVQSGIPHEVWFEDARSMHARLSLISQYQLKGAGYWNLMRPYPQNWPLLNALYRL